MADFGYAWISSILEASMRGVREQLDEYRNMKADIQLEVDI